MRNYELDHKLEHVYTLKAYAEVERKPVNSKNCDRILKLQNKRVHKLMKAAYEIPFYRARFEQSGTTPDDYHCAEDLYKFPLLTKDQLREWMDEEMEKDPDKYKYWHVSPTSGSTGRPLRVLISPREYGWVTANWLRTMGYGGFNPFTGKTMSRPNSLHGPVSEYDSPIQKMGILRRIPVGKTTFDTSWNGFPNPEGKLLTIQYLGDGKALCYSRDEALGTKIDSKSHFYSIINLADGSRSRVKYNGVDLKYCGGRFSQRSAVVNGKAYIGVGGETDGEAEAEYPTIYIYDCKTGAVEKGIELSKGFCFDIIRAMDAK